jgi:hypothetical protein
MTDYNFSQVQPYSEKPALFEVGQQYSIDFEYALGGALSSGDTITTPANALPGGIRVVESELVYPELDTNTTPTGTWDVGDADDVNRFVDGVPMGVAGVTTAGFQLRQGINVAQGLTAGVVSSGVGYLYASGSAPQLVATVASAVATGAASGVVRLRVTFLCTNEGE